MWIAALIYLALPAAGLAAFLVLCHRMAGAGVADAPTLALFALFVGYGGLLQVALTAAFGDWSGLASIGFAALLGLGVPGAVLGALRLRPARARSPYHRAAWRAAAAFPLALATVVGISFLLDR